MLLITARSGLFCTVAGTMSVIANMLGMCLYICMYGLLKRVAVYCMCFGIAFQESKRYHPQCWW